VAMAQRVALEIQGRVEIAEIVEALASAGAQAIRVDPRSGDSGAGVGRYFFIAFDDAGDGDRRRTAFGFHALPSTEAEHGWTRFELGADDRGRRFVENVAERTGGWFIDERTNHTMTFAKPEPAPLLV